MDSSPPPARQRQQVALRRSGKCASGIDFVLTEQQPPIVIGGQSPFEMPGGDKENSHWRQNKNCRKFWHPKKGGGNANERCEGTSQLLTRLRRVLEPHFLEKVGLPRGEINATEIGRVGNIWFSITFDGTQMGWHILFEGFKGVTSRYKKSPGITVSRWMGTAAVFTMGEEVLANLNSPETPGKAAVATSQERVTLFPFLLWTSLPIRCTAEIRFGNDQHGLNSCLSLVFL